MKVTQTTHIPKPLKQNQSPPNQGDAALPFPEWAASQVDHFLQTGSLSGEARRTPLSEQQAGSMELEVGHEVLKAISIDETENDEPGNGPNVVSLKSFGRDGTLHYDGRVDATGNLVEGAALLQQSKGPDSQAAVYAVFSDESTDVLQMVKNGPTSLLHYDKVNQKGSWMAS